MFPRHSLPCTGTSDETPAQHTVLLHDSEELDNDLGARSDQDLAATGLLGVVDGVKRIVEDGGADHFGGVVELRFSNRLINNRNEVSKKNILSPIPSKKSTTTE